jgi:hypothetical protein
MNPKLPLPSHVIDTLMNIRRMRTTGRVEIDVRDGIVRDAWVMRERILQKDGVDIAKRDRD